MLWQKRHFQMQSTYNRKTTVENLMNPFSLFPFFFFMATAVAILHLSASVIILWLSCMKILYSS